MELRQFSLIKSRGCSRNQTRMAARSGSAISDIYIKSIPNVVSSATSKTITPNTQSKMEKNHPIVYGGDTVISFDERKPIAKSGLAVTSITPVGRSKSVQRQRPKSQ